MNDLSTMWNMVLTQRAWSWALIGILHLVLFLCLRSFFFGPILRRAKALNSKWYHEFKKYYSKRSLAGWVFYLLSLLLVIFAWQIGNFQGAALREAGLIALIMLSVCFAIMAHLVALAVAAIHILKQVENNQMSL